MRRAGSVAGCDGSLLLAVRLACLVLVPGRCDCRGDPLARRGRGRDLDGHAERAVASAAFTEIPPTRRSRPGHPAAIATRRSRASRSTAPRSRSLPRATRARPTRRTTRADGPRPRRLATRTRGRRVTTSTTLRVDLNVPGGANCLTLGFRFFTEECRLGRLYNDGFIAELGHLGHWTVDPATDQISAPKNFAFDAERRRHQRQLAGRDGLTTAGGRRHRLHERHAAPQRGTRRVTPARTVLYLSIFDQGDRIVDSAVFVDRLSFAGDGAPVAACPARRTTTRRAGGDPRRASGARPRTAPRRSAAPPATRPATRPT